MTTADDLDAVWAGVRGVFEDAFFTDDYSINRPTPTSDGRGGTTTTPSTVESGKCSVWAAGQQGQEYVSGQRVTGQVDYLAELPWSTTIRDTDEITINSRLFNVLAVKRDGQWGTSVLIELESRT